MKALWVILGLALAGACGDDGGPTGDDLPIPPDGDPIAVDTDQDYDCTATVTGNFANVFVPTGATCNLVEAAVNGNVLARESSRLYVSETQVAGNIDGVEAAVVQVEGGSLGGNIQIADGSSAGEVGASVTGGTVLTAGNIQILKMNTGTVRIADVRVEQGNIQVTENVVSSSLEIVRNYVGQNLQVFTNTGSGSKVVRDNEVLQIVQCKENTSPFEGGPNDTPEAEDQCS